jgi:hypothetical protein
LSQSQEERLPDLAIDLVRLRVDVIVVWSSRYIEPHERRRAPFRSSST